jgi:TonB-linked SusC/RagA family outer membrane protein
MKHIKSKFIIGVSFVCLPYAVNAMTPANENSDWTCPLLTSPQHSSSELGSAFGSRSDSLGNAGGETVQVAYQKVQKSDILGGVSVLDYSELTKKNYNTYSMDNLQGYVGGFNGNCLWGMSGYLVLVDGVPRDANNILPTEIDQITFLKGAQAVVLYGSTAAKGAVLITTKHGNEGSLKVNLRANFGINTAKSYPKYLGSAEYMSLYNEALANDGKSALYSADDIYNYGSGLNPYRYPNVDFYSSDYIRKYYTRSEASAEITGGGRLARFYANIGYYHVGDVFKFGEAANNGTDRLNIRGNVDLHINDFISAYIHSNVSFYDVKSANGSGNYWSQAATLRPNRISPLIPISYINPDDASSMTFINNSQNLIGGQYFLSGSSIDQTNVFADMYASGHGKFTSRQFQFDAGVNVDLAKVLKGLTFNTQFAVDYTTSYSTTYNNTYATYTPTWSNYNGADVISGLVKINNDKKTGVQSISGSADRQTVMFSGQFNYKNTFNEVHNVSAVLVGAGYQQTTAGVYHRKTNVNLGLQLDYNYDHRYFAEFGAAEVHSAKLAEGHRNGFSPSLTLGWNMKNESFLKNSSVVDDLMLSASLSQLNTDLDISDYYMYAENYDQSDGAWWGWKDGVSEHSTNSKRGGNVDLTFIKRKEFSATVRTSLWNHLITAQASFFTNEMNGGIITPSTIVPDYFKTYYPSSSFVSYVNYNKDHRTGFDFSVNANKRFGTVDMSLGVNGMYYTTNAAKRDENYADAYQNRAGRPLDALWGLVSDGFYKDATDVENSPKSSFGTCKPGDIKYVDQNNDGKIDSKDEVYLGKGGWYGAPFTLGVNFTAKWKGFTFFALMTGYYGAKSFKNDTYNWVYGDRKYSEVVRNRWTEATAATATYPRLTTETSDNNFHNSTFWLYSTDHLSLSKIQITYDMPQKWFNNFFISGVSVYVSGSDLLTISGERKQLEMSVGNAPQYRFYNMGLNVKF